MAIRPCFKVGNGDTCFYQELEVEFKYFTGMAASQKKKSMESMHQAILEKEPDAKILEISTKSNEELGVALSAFNLKWKTPKFDFSVESLYQGSKVFEEGGPYKELYTANSRLAKTDERLKNSGRILKYSFQNKDWDLNPPHMFYDFLYIKSLTTNPDLCERVLDYDTFTDIEFNPKKSINCQARAMAIFVTLKKRNLLKEYLDRQLFQKIYESNSLL